MAALQGIKHRIKSVSNTKQITKAMQLVAASKLRRSQETALGPKRYIETSRQLLESLSMTFEAQNHPLFKARKVKKVLIIGISGDRGLAGAYNGNVNRTLSSYAHEIGGNIKVICVGKYVAQHVVRIKELVGIAAYNMECDNPDVELAQPILKEATDLFMSGEVDAVQLIYTKYKTTVSQEVVVEQLMPIRPPEAKLTSRTFEPDANTLIDLAVKRLLEAQLLQAVLEARASEHASRMVAMKNATDNASDLIDDLKLAFNNARQSAITQELAEITAGTEAING
jgi:F-type H+-transporting ATPase subunit gamma